MGVASNDCCFTKSRKILVFVLMSSSYEPCSNMVESPSTTILFAFRIVLSRWAMVSTVRPSDKFSKAFWIAASLTESRALVASSNIKIFGFYKVTYNQKYYWGTWIFWNIWHGSVNGFINMNWHPNKATTNRVERTLSVSSESEK